MDKQRVRKAFLAQRQQLDDQTYTRLSYLAQHRLLESAIFHRAKALALYSPVRREVATGEILRVARSAGKRVYYPRVNGEKLDFLHVATSADLSAGAFGVAEPTAGDAVDAAQLDLMVVPGVAFSIAGYRLGYGKGFYDRQLATLTAATVTVGLGFDFQLVQSLPVEDHDQQLDYIVTDVQFIPCRDKRQG